MEKLLCMSKIEDLTQVADDPSNDRKSERSLFDQLGQAWHVDELGDAKWCARLLVVAVIENGYEAWVLQAGELGTDLLQFSHDVSALCDGGIVESHSNFVPQIAHSLVAGDFAREAKQGANCVAAGNLVSSGQMGRRHLD